MRSPLAWLGPPQMLPFLLVNAGFLVGLRLFCRNPVSSSSRRGSAAQCASFHRWCGTQWLGHALPRDVHPVPGFRCQCGVRKAVSPPQGRPRSHGDVVGGAGLRSGGGRFAEPGYRAEGQARLRIVQERCTCQTLCFQRAAADFIRASDLGSGNDTRQYCSSRDQGERERGGNTRVVPDKGCFVLPHRNGCS